MSDYTGGYGTVNLNGSFAGGAAGCIAMDDSDGDMVYSVTVDIAADTIEYKFTLDGWTAQRSSPVAESCTSTPSKASRTALTSWTAMPPCRWSATTAVTLVMVTVVVKVQPRTL